MKDLANLRFNEEIRTGWINKLHNSTRISSDFRSKSKPNCFCAYGALVDTLVDMGYVEWDDDGCSDSVMYRKNGFVNYNLGYEVVNILFREYMGVDEHSSVFNFNEFTRIYEKNDNGESLNLSDSEINKELIPLIKALPTSKIR